ncbi:MAG: serine/threonine-protein kinase [Archangium sp.]|nr:serine/threonine-protein kinase [Archangium sp.]
MAPEGLQFGRYVLLDRIAAGGMGEVYVGLQTGIGEFSRPVAVKLLLPHLSEDQKIISMFLREARLAAQMTHANIAQVYDVGFEHERYFIAMELVRGVSLSKLISGLKGAGRQVSTELLVYVARSLCDGLHVAHEQRGPDGTPLGVVHRDVTPHNLLVSIDGAVKLTDFGIARVAEGDHLSKPGEVMGKLGYLAPEQLLGEVIDRRVDLFAAGATLFHLAALEKPFDTPTGQVLDPRRLPRAPLRVFRPDLPRPLVDAIERAMNIDPQARFATARDFRLALPEVSPNQDELLGRLVTEVCSAALIDLEKKTERATRPHGTAAITRATPQQRKVAAPVPVVESSASISLGAARPSRWPLALGGLGLVVGLVALGLTLRGPAPADEPVAVPVVAPVAAPVAAPVPVPAPVAAPPEVLPSPRPSLPRGEGDRPLAKAIVSIDASPWGQVWLDGKPLGDTPLAELRIAAGEHQLKVSNPETGKNNSQRLTLKPGERRTVRVDLR